MRRNIITAAANPIIMFGCVHRGHIQCKSPRKSRNKPTPSPTFFGDPIPMMFVRPALHISVQHVVAGAAGRSAPFAHHAPIGIPQAFKRPGGHTPDCCSMMPGEALPLPNTPSQYLTEGFFSGCPNSIKMVPRLGGCKAPADARVREEGGEENQKKARPAN